jgi:ABC-type Fe3+/spermidine/putrescine transport system ATPase subunit
VVVDAGPLGRIETTPHREELSPGASVTLAVRPEQVAISTAPSGAGVSVQGRILSSTYLGDRTFVNVLVQGLESPILVSGAGLPELEALHPEKQVWLDFTRQVIVIAN